MRVLRYVYANINVLNVGFLAAIAAVVLFAVMPLLRMSVKVGLPQAKVKEAVAEKAKEEVPTPSPLDFAMIGENNLFHPERKIPPMKTDEKALPKPELVLYGTIIGDGITVAYVEDKKAPRTTPGRGNRQTIAKKGDMFSGFVLKEIEKDRIVLIRGEETMVVQLSQEKKGRGGAGPGMPQAAPKPGTPVARPGAPVARPATPQGPPVTAGKLGPDPSAPKAAPPAKTTPNQPVNPARMRREGLYNNP